MKYLSTLLSKQKLFCLLLFSISLFSLQAQLAKTYSPAALMDSVFDRFGAKYSLGDIQITPIGINSIALSQLGCGYFDIYYADNSGFDIQSDPTHIKRREVICQVFTDLSAFITQAQPPNGLPPAQIAILVEDPAIMNIQTAALASSF